MPRARHLLRSSIIVIILFGLGKLTGLVRIRLVAQTFGAGTELDAFTAANQLPEVFFVLIAGGSLAAAFIPVYTQYLSQESRQQSARLVNTVLTGVILVLGGLCLIGAIFAPWLAEHLLVPDFSAEQQLLTAAIMRVILLQTTLFGISGVLSSVLNSHQHFALPALAPVALDIGYVIGLYFFVPQMGILGLAWGTVIGALLHIAIQTPALVRYGFRYHPTLDLAMPGVREVVRLMGPRIVTLGVIQAADLFTIRLTSGLVTGATTAYFLAYGLMQMPQTLFGTAIALVVFPTLSELYNAGDIEGLKRTAVNTISVIWILTIPSVAVVILMGRPIIEVLFQGGEFDSTATQLVYSVLVVLSFRIVSESTLEIVARLFYAQHNTRTPMLAYIGWLIVTIILVFPLVERIGLSGLALATTISFTLLAAVLYVLNSRALGGLGQRQLLGTLWRSVLATLAMSLAIEFAGRLVDNTLLSLVIAGIIGLVVYVLVLFLLGGQEFRTLLSLLKTSPSSTLD